MSAYLSTLFGFYSRKNFSTSPSPAARLESKLSSYDVVHAGEHLFKVVGHSQFKDGDGCLTSEPFTVGGYDWAIIYYPNGDARVVDGQHTPLFLKLLSPCEDGVTPSYTFSFLDPASPATGEKNKRKGSTKFSSSNPGFGTDTFLSRADLAASGCLQDDCLVIKVTVKIVTTKLIEGRYEHDDDENSVVVPPSDLSEDPHDLLFNRDLKADVTVKIGWFRRFQVHGCVLAAHSPVFGALLESKQNSIRVEDIDAKVFEVMLHYLYKDSLPDFMDETTEEAISMARHLLVAAHRYEIQRLKLICQSKLSKVIDVKTLGATLAFAEEHNCQQLKVCCLDYMARDGDRLRAIMKTEGFRQLKKKHPLVADNILDKLIAKL